MALRPAARCHGGAARPWRWAPGEARPPTGALVLQGPAEAPLSDPALDPPEEWLQVPASDPEPAHALAWASLPLVPWDIATAVTVLAMWLLGFWALAYGLLPCLLAMAGLDPASPAPTFQALRHLALDVAQLGFTVALLGRALRDHAPLSRGFFALRPRPLAAWAGTVLVGAATFPAIHAVHRWAVAFMNPGYSVGAGGSDAAARALLGSGGGGTRALWFFMLAVCAPVWEEVMFRGFLLPSMATHMPGWAATLASAVLFACVHFSRENFLPLLLLGCVFGTAYRHRANLLPCIALHSLWNIFLLLSVCGF